MTVHRDPLDRIEARGLGFSELQSYWSLPFHDYAVVGDVAVIKDQHGRQLQVRSTFFVKQQDWLRLVSRVFCLLQSIVKIVTRRS